jgi:uncharacterized protein (TIGR03435 family)
MARDSGGLSRRSTRMRAKADAMVRGLVRAHTLVRRPGRVRRITPLVLVLLFVAGLAAQTPPAFEVASVKANRSGENRVGFGFPPGGLTATNMPVRALIIQAYRLQEYELVNLPGWAADERFDVTARSSHPQASADERRVMLQALLADRFKLRMHPETREMAMYSLVFARDDQRLGPGLTPSPIDCAARSRGTEPSAAAPPAPTPPAGEQPLPECGISLGMTPAASFLRGGSVAFPEIVRLIATNLGRPVVDKTGLVGAFNIRMRFHSQSSGLPGMPVRPPGGAAATPDDSVPSLTTAVQEQLGLKLEPGRAPVPIQVVDSVERPTED